MRGIRNLAQLSRSSRILRSSVQECRAWSRLLAVPSLHQSQSQSQTGAASARTMHTSHILRDIVKSPFPDLEPPIESLYDYVFKDLSKFAYKTAFIDGVTGREVTFIQFHDEVQRVASGLHRAGLRKGDVLLIASPNSIEYAVTFLATISLGGTVTLVNPLYPADDIKLQAVGSNSTYIVCSKDQVEKINQVAEEMGNIKSVWVIGDDAGGNIPYSSLSTDDGSAHPGKVHIDPKEDIAILPYSSGTTGLPKGVMLTHYSVVANVAQAKNDAYWPEMEGAVCSGVLPFYHIFAIFANILTGVAWGRTSVVLPSFEPVSFLETIQTYKVSLLFAVPPIILFMAKHPVVEKYDISSIIRVIAAAAPLGKEVEEGFLNKYPQCTIGQGYGLTETSPVVSIAPIADSGKSFGTIGVLMANTEGKFVNTENGEECGEKEDGELWIRGPQTMLGYLNNPEATANTIDQNGWFHTGDVGHFEGQNLYLVDRVKELIKYKGLQVPPAELEALLCTHPAVADAGVIGFPDEEAGELPKAFVALKPGADATEEELRKFVDEKVVGYKKLRGGLSILEAIPRSAAGKILRRELKNL